MDVPVYKNFADFKNMIVADVKSVGADLVGDFCYITMPDDSMTPRFKKDDLILCKKTQKANPGSTVIFCVGEEYYIRKMSYEKDFLQFIPENTEYETLSFAGVSLRNAKVKAVVVE